MACRLVEQSCMLENLLLFSSVYRTEQFSYLALPTRQQRLRKGYFYASRNLRFPFANHYLYEARNEGILNG